MEMIVKATTITILLPVILCCIPCGESGSRGRSLAQRLPALGVDYGQTADNLPPPSAVAKLVQSTSISKLRLYGADPAILQAFANTGIGLVVGIGNDQIPSLNQLAVAQNWIKNNIVPFVPATDIIGISVGNEVLFSGDGSLISQLLPALQNLHTALVEVSLDQQIKVSTPHSLAILSTSADIHPLALPITAQYPTTKTSELVLLWASDTVFTRNLLALRRFQSEQDISTWHFGSDMFQFQALSNSQSR